MDQAAREQFQTILDGILGEDGLNITALAGRMNEALTALAATQEAANEGENAPPNNNQPDA